MISVAEDLYQKLPKTTCHPERNKKYEMLHDAKFACANDRTCSGVVEAPKRRGQNRKYGNFSITDKEWIICDYPAYSKPTADTLLLRKRGEY